MEAVLAVARPTRASETRRFREQQSQRQISDALSLGACSPVQRSGR